MKIKHNKMKHKFIIGIGLVLVLIIAGCSSQNSQNSGGQDYPRGEVTIFKSMSCGCCGVYSQYMQKEGFKVDVRNLDNPGDIKSKFGIPYQMQSCHTTQIGDYFVEGHVPVEAIEKLMAEKPDIKGIALPGMPSGSPGMLGSKTAKWTIYAVNHDGSSYEFMTI